MATRYRVSIAAVACIIAIGGCSGSTENACDDEAGARACLTENSSGGGREIKATGFLPNSDVLVTRDGPQNPKVPDTRLGAPTEQADAPMRVHIGADGASDGVLGVVGVAGPVTFTLSGTAGTGTEVVLSLVVGD